MAEIAINPRVADRSKLYPGLTVTSFAIGNKSILPAVMCNFDKTKAIKMDSKEKQIMDYLMDNVFNPILNSNKASASLKHGVQYTIMRLNERNDFGMIRYYWAAIIGTDKSTKFARQMKKEGFVRFEELIEEFREKFNDKWLKS